MRNINTTKIKTRQMRKILKVLNTIEMILGIGLFIGFIIVLGSVSGPEFAHDTGTILTAAEEATLFKQSILGTILCGFCAGGLAGCDRLVNEIKAVLKQRKRRHMAKQQQRIQTAL